MCNSLAPLASRLLLVPVHSERTEQPARLVEACLHANADVTPEVCDSLGSALERVRGEPFVVVAGSLYLVGEAMELLKLSETPADDEKPLNDWRSSR